MFPNFELFHHTFPQRRAELEAIIKKYRQFENSAVEPFVEHLFGQKTFNCKNDEFIVGTVVKDGEIFIEPFIQHYKRLGARHIVILDNGSTDKTIEIAKKYSCVTILRCRLPFSQFKFALKRYLLDRIGKKRWALLADIDEFFDFPGSDLIKMGDFLSYLSSHGYTAVVTHMLDLFPSTRLLEQNSSDFVKECRFYDLRNFSYESFEGFEKSSNFGIEISNPAIKWLRGGQRSAIFGSIAVSTKAPLVYNDERSFMRSDHFPAFVKYADISAVFYHYKYTIDFKTRVEKAVKDGQYFANSVQYRGFLRTINVNPKIRLKTKYSKELKSVQDLVDNGFLLISNQYKKFLKSKHGKPKKKKAILPLPILSHTGYEPRPGASP